MDARNDYIVTRVNGKRINVLDDEIVDAISNEYFSGKSYTDISIDELRDNDYVLTLNRYEGARESEIPTLKL